MRARHAAAGVVLAAVVAVGATSCVLAWPSRASVGPAPAALGAEAVAFASASGSTIHAWLAAGRRGGGAVLLLHGVHANRTVMLGRASLLHDAGYTVLIPDFQAHGESPGEHITFGALESLDAHAALAYLRARAPGECVGAIGVSGVASHEDEQIAKAGAAALG
jgi:predicted alpha/beta-fold hydrolase